MPKQFSYLSVFVRYFGIVGCLSSIIHSMFPIIGVMYFIWSFLTFVDQDIVDPEEPNEIEDIGEDYFALFT